MEIKFNQRPLRCLDTLTTQSIQREETQEVRLPDGMPDIGRILGCWGQPVLRSKEWRSGGMNIGGGVMAWVLYAPEDGSQPQTVDAWIPFQQKWEFDDGGRDGFICVLPLLKSIDARSTSARKMMIRTNISTWANALQNMEYELYEPETVPEDVQLLQQTYPMELPLEFGEKQIQIEETVDLPGTLPAVDQIIRYELIPQVTEQRVMASRLVFRGMAKFRLLYLSGGKVHSWETQIPFSQYADLDRDFGSGATARIIPLLTNLELENIENGLQLKAGIAAQYIIYDRMLTQIVEDAYSTLRDVRINKSELKLPLQLDQLVQPVQVNAQVRGDVGTLVDVCHLWDHPHRRQNSDGVEVIMNGNFQTLYYDPNGNLQSATSHYEQPIRIASDEMNRMDGFAEPMQIPETMGNGEGINISQEMQLGTRVYSNAALEMITGLELGELSEPDPNRPSIILRRCGENSLWNLAKESGSTVEAIRRANELEGEPENGRMLLIPVC